MKDAKLGGDHIRATLLVSVLPQMSHCLGGAWWPPRSSVWSVKAVTAFAKRTPEKSDSLSRDGSSLPNVPSIMLHTCKDSAEVSATLFQVVGTQQVPPFK